MNYIFMAKKMNYYHKKKWLPLNGMGSNKTNGFYGIEYFPIKGMVFLRRNGFH